MPQDTDRFLAITDPTGRLTVQEVQAILDRLIGQPLVIAGCEKKGRSAIINLAIADGNDWLEPAVEIMTDILFRHYFPLGMKVGERNNISKYVTAKACASNLARGFSPLKEHKAYGINGIR